MTFDEAHRILSNGLLNAPSEHEWCMAFEMAIKALEQEPYEDKPQGEWIPVQIKDKRTGKLENITIYCIEKECSICKSRSIGGKYCPNCGAKMQEVEN